MTLPRIIESTTGNRSARRAETSRATRATACTTLAAEWISSAEPRSCCALSGVIVTGRERYLVRPPRLRLLPGAGLEVPQIGAELGGHFWMLQRHLDVRLQVDDLAAAVVAHAVEL